jgi:hypothetical protein
VGRQDEYINYIVEELVSGTVIDYDREEINCPFFLHTFLLSFEFSKLVFYYPSFPDNYKNYMKNNYGIYNKDVYIKVWDRYRDIIFNSIENE